MDLLIPIVSIFFLGWLAHRCWKRETILQSVFLYALACKLMAAATLGIIYLYYYPSGDTFLFFHDGRTLTEWGKQDFRGYVGFLWNSDETSLVWKTIRAHEPRTLFFSKIVSIVNFLTNSNYWVTALYLSFISFLCSLLFARNLVRYYPNAKWQAIISVLFIPSAVFWGSGIVKECLAMAALFFLASIFLRGMKSDRVSLWDYLSGLFFIWLLWRIKYYYAAVFLMVTLTSLIVHFAARLLKIRRPALQVLLWVFVFFIPLYLLSLSRENFHFENFLDVIVRNYDAYQQISAPHKIVQYHDLRPTVISLLINAPWALLSGLFRPFIWEVQNIFQLLAALENMLLFVLIVSAIRKIKRDISSTDCILILTAAVYVVLLCTFLAFSAPNFGTLSRYRIGFLPFLFFLISCENNFVKRFIAFIQRSFSRLVR